MYDGASYHGYQIQPNDISVQEVIEKALSTLGKQTVAIVGSGRTDAGVHALAQYAHFIFPYNLTAQQMRLALRTKLPDSIRVTEVYKVNGDIHARFSARKREYLYYLTRQKTPFNRYYKSFVPNMIINVEHMKTIIPHIIGKYDFASFAKPNPQIKNTVCDLTEFDIKEENNDVIFHISANRFLHNMVRRLVGTLITFSHHNYKPELFVKIREDKCSNQKIIFTAPPNGLYLAKVHYPNLKEQIIDSSIE